MLVLSTRDSCFFCIGIIVGLCLPIQTALAGDTNLFNRISPHISLNQNNPSQELASLAISKNPPAGGYLTPGSDYTSPSLHKNLRVQDLFSLALGARFQISDWLGVDAACSMPLVEEETTWKKDLSLEAMVTMQF